MPSQIKSVSRAPVLLENIALVVDFWRRPPVGCYDDEPLAKQ
jgi:hypothetical protein